MKILKPDFRAQAGRGHQSLLNLKPSVLANLRKLSLHQMKSQTLRPVARGRFENAYQPRSRTRPPHGSQQSCLRKQSADTAPAAHREEKIGVLGGLDPKFRIKVHVCFNSLGAGVGGRSRSRILGLPFPLPIPRSMCHGL